MKFEEFDLDDGLLRSIQSLGFSDCTPIQEKAIPQILDGKDIAGLAQTGTGKTAAYLVPLLDRIFKSIAHAKEDHESLPDSLKKRVFEKWGAHNFILVLVPTRELAEQVTAQVLELTQEATDKPKAVAVYGGASPEQQKKALANGAQVIVATPGRLIDFYKSHIVDLKQVRGVVFDEADRMFDMGFKDDMVYILKRIPRRRHFLVFSATLNFDVLNVAYQFEAHPVEINVSRDQAKAENVKDEVLNVSSGEKPSYLLSLLNLHNPRQAIIFSNFKSNVMRIAQFLVDNGVPAMGISSALNQSQRSRILQQFKEGKETTVLVATDLAARGLDVSGIDLVINYELPDDPEVYVHRIGRTGRASGEGLAVSLASDRDVAALQRIEQYLKHKLSVGWLEEEKIIKDHKPLPPSDWGQSRKSTNKSRGDGKGTRRGSSTRRRGSAHQGKGKVSRRDSAKASGGSLDKEKNANATTSDETASGSGTHRDRLSGRHRQNRQKAGAARRRDADSASKKKARPTSKKRKVAASKPTRTKPTKRRSSAQSRRGSKSASSISQKVSGFFKKLFKK